MTEFVPGGNGALSLPDPTSKAPPPPARNIYISFQGVGQSSGERQSFQVMCGANPPTAVGGYANYQDLNRPLTDALTIFQNRAPTALQFNIIFGRFVDEGWQTDDVTGRAIARDIDKLEWMAGQNFDDGPPPVVYAFTYSNKGGQTDLIPQGYRDRPWVINAGIQWGKAWRNQNGYRIWAEATFTVKNYLNLHKPPKPDTNTSGGYFKTRPGRDTALLIAGAPSGNAPFTDVNSLAYQVLASAKNNPCKGTTIRLQRKAITWQIRHGVDVWVPGHIIN